MKSEDEPITDDEFLLRRVRVERFRPKKAPIISHGAFEPRFQGQARDPDTDGISLYREACLTGPADVLATVDEAKRPHTGIVRVSVAFVKTRLAIVARFRMQRDGLLGAGVFLALFGSYLAHFVIRPDGPETDLPVLIANILNMASLIGMVVFFYVVARNPHLARNPWPGGSLGMNLPRYLSAGLLILGLAGCGYCFDSLWHSGPPAHGSSEFVPLALASATSYAGCLVAVAGLTTGYDRLPWRSEHTARTGRSI